jgi:hypothetical protein
MINVRYIQHKNVILFDEINGVRWAGHVACMGEREMRRRSWWGNLNIEDDLDDSGLELGIILERML